jgi:hypothetical protein
MPVMYSLDGSRGAGWHSKGRFIGTLWKQTGNRICILYVTMKGVLICSMLVRDSQMRMWI